MAPSAGGSSRCHTTRFARTEKGAGHRARRLATAMSFITAPLVLEALPSPPSWPSTVCSCNPMASRLRRLSTQETPQETSTASPAPGTSSPERTRQPSPQRHANASSAPPASRPGRAARAAEATRGRPRRHAPGRSPGVSPSKRPSRDARCASEPPATRAHLSRALPRWLLPRRAAAFDDGRHARWRNAAFEAVGPAPRHGCRGRVEGPPASVLWSGRVGWGDAGNAAPHRRIEA